MVQALEELALPSVLPLGEIGVEGVIRRGTTCFAVQTTPLRLRSPVSGRGCVTKEVATILSAAPLCNHLWRGGVERWPHVARA